LIICDDYTHKIELLQRLLCQIDEITDFNADIAENRAKLKGIDDKIKEKESQKQKQKFNGTIGSRISLSISQLVTKSKSAPVTPIPQESISSFKNRKSLKIIKPDAYPKNRKELIVDLEYLKSFKLKGYSDCISVCKSIGSFNTYLFYDKLDDELYFNEYDLFLLFETITHNNVKWSLVKKVRMNCSPLNRKRIKIHSDLKDVMLEYSKSGKVPQIYIDLGREFPTKKKQIVNFVSLCDEDRISEDIVIKDLRSPSGTAMNSPRFSKLDKITSSGSNSSDSSSGISGSFHHISLSGKSKSLKSKFTKSESSFTVNENLTKSDNHIEFQLNIEGSDYEKKKEDARKKKKLSFIGKIASKLFQKTKEKQEIGQSTKEYSEQFYQSLANRPDEKLEVGLIPSALLEEFSEEVSHKLIERFERRDNEELEVEYEFYQDRNFNPVTETELVSSDQRKSRVLSLMLKKTPSSSSISPRESRTPRNSSGRESDAEIYE
jgi:hypothetical protein